MDADPRAAAPDGGCGDYGEWHDVVFWTPEREQQAEAWRTLERLIKPPDGHYVTLYWTNGMFVASTNEAQDGDTLAEAITRLATALEREEGGGDGS